MNVNPEQAPDEHSRSDIGVLFVHGIGAQSRGQTLAEFGAPVHDWLIDRFHGLDRQWRAAIDNAAAPSALKAWRTQVEAWADDGFQPAQRPSLSEPGEAEPGPNAVLDPQQIAELAREVGSDGVVAGRAALLDTVIRDPNDSSAPAHSKLRFQRQRLSGEIENERWLLAESWWAETFAAPSFSELVEWGYRIIPGTVGNHFGAQLARALKDRPRNAPQGFQTTLWVLRVAASFARLLAALLLSPLLVAGFAILLLVGLIPIPQVRQALLALQLKFAATLGDSYVLVSRPIEAASIVGQVRRDIAWLAKRCKIVIVVAHSQGGAVVHRAVQEDTPPQLKLLFTFGSGFRKLEELKFLLLSGHSYRRAAVYTLIAVTLFCITAAWFVLGAVSGRLMALDRSLLGSVASMAGFALASFVFLVAGIRDHLRGIDVPALNRWADRLKSRPFDWVDCYASADPVSNGSLLDEPEVEQRSQEVCNTSSILKDHTSYWKNRDQFLSVLIDKIVQPTLRKEAGLAPAPEFATSPAALERIGKRRRWRVGIAGAIDWIAILSVLYVCFEQRQSCWNFLLYWFGLVSAWSASLFGGAPQAQGEFAVSWSTLGYLALVLIPYWVTRSLWRTWNASEMDAAIVGASAGRPIPVAIGIWAQLIFVAGIWFAEVPPTWIFFAILVAPLLTILLTEPSAARESKLASRAAQPDAVPSDTDKLRRWLLAIYVVLMPAFVLGLLVWNGLTWIANRFFGGSIFGLVAGDVSSILVASVAAPIYGMGYYLLRRKNGWRRAHD